MSNDVLIYHPSVIIKDCKLPDDYDPEIHGYPDMLEDEDLFSDEHCYALKYFLSGGKNIFHLEPEILQMLSKTSIDEVVLEDVSLPFDSFYLHFGEESGILTPNYMEDYDKPFEPKHLFPSHIPIVGAYIKVHRDYDNSVKEMTVLLTPEAYSDVHGSYAIDLPFHAQSGFVRKGVKNRVLDVFRDSVHRNPFENDIDNQKMNNDPILGKNIDWHQAKDNWRPKTEALAWEATSTEVLKLVFNSILFLTSPDSDVEEDYPSTYPQKLVNKARSGNAKEAKRAESKLASQGYTKIKFVGRSVKKYFQASNTGTTVSTHWRRGHWRKQPFGAKAEGNKRLVWIKPTIVNKDFNTEKPMNGHIYEV